MFKNIEWVPGSLEVEGGMGMALHWASDVIVSRKPQRVPCQEASANHHWTHTWAFYTFISTPRDCICFTFRIGTVDAGLPPNPPSSTPEQEIFLSGSLAQQSGRKANSVLSKLAQNNTQEAHTGRVIFSSPTLSPCFLFWWARPPTTQFLKPNSQELFLMIPFHSGRMSK